MICLYFSCSTFVRAVSETSFLYCLVCDVCIVLYLQNLPEIKKYMESDAYDKKLPMNNKMAAFGNKV